MNPNANPMSLLGTRQALLQIVAQALDGLSAEDNPALLTFWASRGGGQTTFLAMVQEEFSGRTDVVPVGPWDFRMPERDGFAAEILLSVDQAAAMKKIVLLDNIDALLKPDDDTALFEFEQGVIHALLGRSDTLIVATSQIELGLWHEYAVRLRHQSHRIPALSHAETSLVCAAWDLDAELAYRLTHGHPQALEWLRAEPELTERDVTDRADTYFLEGLAREEADFARVASLLPHFNVALVRQILSDDKQTTNGAVDGLLGTYLDQIRALIRVGLLRWEIKVGAYRFADSAVRRLLARNFQFRQPAEYARIQHASADYFKEEARFASFLHLNFVSALYHLAQTAALEQADSAPARCLKWVSDNLETWEGVDWNAVLEAWKTGAADEGVKEEMQSLLSQTKFDQITQMLEDTKSKVEALL